MNNWDKLAKKDKKLEYNKVASMFKTAVIDDLEYLR